MPPWCNLGVYLDVGVVSNSSTIHGRISVEAVGLRGAENLWCCLDLEFLGVCRNDVVYQTLTTETDKGFDSA